MAFASEKTYSMGVSVKSSIKNTLAYHHQLKGIQESRQASIHEIRRAKAGWLPSVDFVANSNVGYSKDPARRARRDTSLDDDQYNTASAELVISQPLWDGFATSRRVKSTEIQQKTLDSNVIDTATALALDALIAHADVMLKRKLLRYARENVEQHAGVLQNQRTLTTEGASTIANVYQIEGRLARADAQLIAAQGALLEAEENYLRITGSSSPSVLKEINMPEVMFENAEACYKLAQEQNPKILSLLSSSKYAQELKNIGASAYQPNINLEVSLGTELRGDDYADTMLVMRWNLFNGGADIANNRALSAEYRVARQNLFDIIDTIRQESSSAWTQYTISLEQEKLYIKAMKFNTQTKESFMEQFLIGERRLLDVLDSYSELYSSSIQWATVRTNSYISAYTMFALAGNLLEQFDINDTDVLVAP